MRQVESLSQARWECKYPIVFIPKDRRKTLFGQVRKELGEVFHRLARQKESLIEEGHIMVDHVHSVPRSGGIQEGEATCCM
jgi:putative transposase